MTHSFAVKTQFGKIKSDMVDMQMNLETSKDGGEEINRQATEIHDYLQILTLNTWLINVR